MLNFLVEAGLGATSEGKTVPKKKSLFENLFVLLVLGLLAGAVGGLGIGLFQLRALSQSSASTASPGK